MARPQILHHILEFLVGHPVELLLPQLLILLISLWVSFLNPAYPLACLCPTCHTLGYSDPWWAPIGRLLGQRMNQTCIEHSLKDTYMTTIITFECGIHRAKSFKHINSSMHLLRIFFYYKNNIYLKNEYFNKRVLVVSRPRFLKYGVSPYQCRVVFVSHTFRILALWTHLHTHFPTAKLPLEENL